MANLEPRVRRTPQNIQCLYNTDYRLHTVQAYPILSPQGASIFLYGHENGVTVVWRGGRRLKRASKAEAKSVPNNDAVMVLDSDSDDGAAAAAAASASTSATSAIYVDNPVFEDALSAETAHDGFPPVQQTLDLALGMAVLHVSVLPLAPSVAKDAEPSLLREQMVFAVSCATNDIYVVTLPLTPPSHESKERPQLQLDLLSSRAGHRAFGEVLIPLGGQTKRADGVALTLAKQSATTARTSNSNSGSATSATQVRIIVAAHSHEASGTLRLWDVTVDSKHTASATTLSALDRPLDPFQTEYLPRPLAGVAFNPTHPTQLLAVSPQDAVRVYDYTIPAIPSDDMSEGPFPAQGSWLLSLYPPFSRNQTTTAVRKPIVAASWVAHGHAILTLLADGQWGIWDVYRNNGNTATLGSRSATSRNRGASLAAFSISGQIEGTTPLRNPAASTRKSAEGEFVPMTPHTRRDALASAFSAKVEGLVALRGGVEVVQQYSVHGGSTPTESAVLWLGGTDYIVAVIPDVTRFWDAQLRGGGGGGVNLFSGARPARMIRLMDLNASLMGERCCGVSAVSQVSKPRPRGLDEDGEEGEDEDVDEKVPWINSKLPIEIIVQGESRLVMIRDNTEDIFSGDLTSRLLASSKKRKDRGAVNTAIVVETRPRQPDRVGVVLGANKSGSLSSGIATGRRDIRPGTSKSLFAVPSQPAASATPTTPTPKVLHQQDRFDNINEVSFTQSMMAPPKMATENNKLAFAGDLSKAANASDDEDAANERNVEEEMLNIMEIDQALEAMEEHHGADSQNVFFEGE